VVQGPDRAAERNGQRQRSTQRSTAALSDDVASGPSRCSSRVLSRRLLALVGGASRRRGPPCRKHGGPTRPPVSVPACGTEVRLAYIGMSRQRNALVAAVTVQPTYRWAIRAAPSGPRNRNGRDTPRRHALGAHVLPCPQPGGPICWACRWSSRLGPRHAGCRSDSDGPTRTGRLGQADSDGPVGQGREAAI
jgi:hypothetical protein